MIDLSDVVSAVSFSSPPLTWTNVTLWLPSMNVLQFVLRIGKTDVVLHPQDGLRASVEYRVECRSHPGAFANPCLYRTAHFDGSRAETWFTTLGWVPGGGEGRFEYELALPISNHQFLELSEGVLSRYWTREQIVEAFQYANDHMEG